MQFALLLPNIPHSTDGRADMQPMLSFVHAAPAPAAAQHTSTSLWASVKPFVPFVR